MLKRSFDLFFSTIGLVLLSPVLLIISFLVYREDRGPIFFRQERVGKDEITFRIFKFRTMFIDAEKRGTQITIGHKDPRVTSTGYFLRRYKIDELPQLINVLKGEMSFVGPRPEVPRYVRHYNESQKKVLSVRPGITDFASIYFKDESELLAKASDPESFYISDILPKKLELSLKYVERQSLYLDVMLVLKTIFSILR